MATESDESDQMAFGLAGSHTPSQNIGTRLDTPTRRHAPNADTPSRLPHHA
jgi:hypothetical protein